MNDPDLTVGTNRLGVPIETAPSGEIAMANIENHYIPRGNSNDHVVMFAQAAVANVGTFVCDHEPRGNCRFCSLSSRKYARRFLLCALSIGHNADLVNAEPRVLILGHV